MMRKMSAFALGLTIFCFSLLNFDYTFAAEKTLAVLDFENNSLFNVQENQPLSKGLAEMMITELSKIKAVRVVERQKLRSLLDEIKMSQAGMVSETSSVQAGRMLGAQHLVFGGYMVTMDKKIRIDVRIVQVETGLTIKASEVTGKTRQVLSLIQKLSKKILDDLDVKLTGQEKRSLDKSDKIDMQAVVQFSQGLEFEDLGKMEEAKQCYLKALKIEPDFLQAKMRLQRLMKKE